MKVRKTKEEEFIISYFQNLNVSPSRSFRQFMDNLYRNHNKDKVDKIKRAMEMRADEQDGGEDIYRLKNDNLSLSLDFTRFSANLYRSFFDWLVKRKDFNPTRILDLGCDNGFVTCFYGLFYPDAEVVGIDAGENGIRCANELKEKLNLSNVTFKNIGIEDIDKHFEEGSFDLVTSIRTLHEVIEFPTFKGFWSYDDIDYGAGSEWAQKVLGAVRKILNPNAGRLITWERIVGAQEFIWWVRQLENSKLYVDWKESDGIKFYELDDSQTMPLLVLDNLSKESLNTFDIIKLYVEKVEEVKIDFNNKKEYIDAAADFAFKSTKEKEFLSGLQINYSEGSRRARMEIWKLNDAFINFEYSDGGYRKLRIFPLNMLDMARSELEKVKKYMENSGQRTFWYDSIEERDRIFGNK